MGDLPRYGTYAAGVVFCLAYAMLMFDPSARSEMAPWISSTGASLALVLWDERRLAAEDALCGLPGPSRTLDVIAFGQIAVVMHFLRTRWRRGRALAVGIAAAACLGVTTPQIGFSMLDDPGQTARELPETLIVLAFLPLPIALVWRAFVLLSRRVDLEGGLVLVGITITFGGATAIAMAIPAPLWGSALLFAIFIGVMAHALVRDRRDMKSR